MSNEQTAFLLGFGVGVIMGVIVTLAGSDIIEYKEQIC